MTEPKRRRTNLPASVHDRLLGWARQQGEQYQLVLTRYCLERFLYRLSQSPHHKRFILKGAMLFTLWTGHVHRPTRDLDLLGRGDSSVEGLEGVIRNICNQPVEDDGVVFLADTVRGERLREEEEYQGVRIHFDARQTTARLRLQIDVGFGDAVTPRPEAVTYPTLLDFPAPAVLAYTRESVIAEKFHTLVVRGMLNSRLKDFWDLSVLAQQFALRGPLLCQAIGATFERRKTAVPAEPPVALTAEFHGDAGKQQDWRTFLQRHGLQAEGIGLDQVAGILHGFLMPPVQALARGQPFDMEWPARGPWAPAGKKGSGDD
jgi:hypothetical protein